MFDTFMERSLPLWMLFTALFASMVAATLIKAAFRIRHLRALLEDSNRRTGERIGAVPGSPWPPAEGMENEDWVARKG